MDSNALFLHRKAIRKLFNIEGNGALATLGRHLSSEYQRLKICSEEANRKLMQELSSKDKEIIRIHGRNLNIEELKNILESESWYKGFNDKTSNLMKRYDFLTDTFLVYKTASNPTEETIEAFKTSGVISQTTLNEIMDSFNIPDVAMRFRETLAIALEAAEAETDYKREKQWIDGSMASIAIPTITPLTNDSQGLDNISATSEKKALELKVLRDIQENAENSRFTRIKRHDYSHNLSNLFPTFLCIRTDVFMFRSIPVDKFVDAEFLRNYKYACVRTVTRMGLNIVAFCQKAKAACATIKTIFEVILRFRRYLFSSSSSEIDDEKEFKREMFAELCVLKCEIEEQKQRCRKFLIDVDIFLVHDPPLPKSDDGHWTDRQLYMFRLAIKRAELSIRILRFLVFVLKDIQNEFLFQYNTI